MISTILALTLTVVVVGFVVYPLFRRRKQSPLGASDGQEDLLLQKQATYEAIKELEFEWAMGKISEEDFRELDRSYKMQAARILKNLESSPRDDEIEEAIARARKRR